MLPNPSSRVARVRTHARTHAIILLVQSHRQGRHAVTTPAQAKAQAQAQAQTQTQALTQAQAQTQSQTQTTQ